MSKIKWTRHDNEDGSAWSEVQAGDYGLKAHKRSVGWAWDVALILATGSQVVLARRTGLATREEAEAAAVEGLRRQLTEALAALPASRTAVLGAEGCPVRWDAGPPLDGGEEELRETGSVTIIADADDLLRVVAAAEDIGLDRAGLKRLAEILFRDLNAQIEEAQRWAEGELRRSMTEALDALGEG